MKKYSCKISFTPRKFTISTRVRIHRLGELATMLSDFYIPYSKEVASSYSCQEQKILVGIIKKMIYQLRDAPLSSMYHKKYVCNDQSGLSDRCTVLDHQMKPGDDIQFRLTLDSTDPFSTRGRSYSLQHLDDMLGQFFSLCDPAVNGRPYSHREQILFARIIRLLVHELRGTPHYQLFIKEHRPKQLTPSEKLELRNQQKDYTRLLHTRITLYNPLSEMYKAEKEKLLRKIEAMK